MNKKNFVKILSEKTHALKRAGRYLGQITPAEINRYTISNIDDKDYLWYHNIKYVPAFLKIIREFLDNSVDEAIRTNYSFSNNISIDITEEYVKISDNGRGIPIVNAHDEHGKELDLLMPEAAWINLRAGSNFDDEEDNKTMGQNGEGASLGVFFAKKFIGETRDGSKIFTIITEDNVEKKDIIVVDKKLPDSKRGTSIIFYPDKEKLNITGSLEEYTHLIKFELLFLSMTHPKISFSINKEKIKIKEFNDIKPYFKYPQELLGDQQFSLMTFETENVTIGVANSLGNGYTYLHFINGINAYNGGDVLDYAEKRVLQPFIDKIQNKYKNIKTADIKNHLMFIAIFKNIPNPRFADQIKSQCINTATQFPDIAKELLQSKDEIEKFINKLYKNKTIMEPIVDIYKATQMVLEKKKAKDAQKNKKTPAKYWPATKVKKRLFLSEGDSAINPLISEIDRHENGFFPLKGKMINCMKKKLSLIVKNDEVLELSDILNIDLTKDDNGTITKPLNYDEIYIAADADVDGGHIVLLVLGFFLKFAPAYLEDCKIYRFKTPILIAIKNNKPVKMFFNFSEYNEYDKNKPKGVSYFYAKGLGSLTEKHWSFLFSNYTLEELSVPLTLKDSTNRDFELSELVNWLGDDSDFRKRKILDLIQDFDIDKI